MQEILDYLQGKGDIIFFDWNNPDIMDFKLMVIDNFIGNESDFDLTNQTIKSQIIPN